MIVHLNRLQNEANFHLANVVKGSTQVIHNEKMDNGWIAPFNVLDWDLSWWWWNKNNRNKRNYPLICLHTKMNRFHR